MKKQTTYTWHVDMTKKFQIYEWHLHDLAAKMSVCNTQFDRASSEDTDVNSIGHVICDMSTDLYKFIYVG